MTSEKKLFILCIYLLSPHTYIFRQLFIKFGFSNPRVYFFELRLFTFFSASSSNELAHISNRLVSRDEKKALNIFPEFSVKLQK